MSSAERLLGRKIKLPLPLFKEKKIIQVSTSFSDSESFNNECASLLDNENDIYVLKQCATEIAVDKILRNKKNDYLDKGVTSKHNSSRNFTDYDLFLSAMKKVNELQAIIQKKDDELDVSRKKIRQLEDELVAVRDSCKDAVCANTSNKLSLIQKRVTELQTQVTEMNEFLSDYGLIWVGSQGSGETSKASNFRQNLCEFSAPTAIEIVGNSLSELTFCQLFASIANLNESIQADEVKVMSINKEPGFNSEAHVVKLGRIKPLLLYIYADGILIFSGHFRTYTQTSTLRFLQDILDGYFPSELQRQFPEGVPLLAVDRRHEFYCRGNQTEVCTELADILSHSYETSTIPGAFHGTGHRLGGESKMSRLNQLNERNKVEYFQPSTSRDAQQSEAKDDVSACTLNDLLAKLPSPTNFGATKFGQTTGETFAVTDELVYDEMMGTGSSVGDLCLRIRSPRGDNIYTVTAHATDTIEMVHSVLDKFLNTDSTNEIYQLVVMVESPAAIESQAGLRQLRRMVLANRKQTLTEAGIHHSMAVFMEPLEPLSSNNLS